MRVPSELEIHMLRKVYEGKTIQIDECLDDRFEMDFAGLRGKVLSVDMIGTLNVQLEPDQREGQPDYISLVYKTDKYHLTK